MGNCLSLPDTQPVIGPAPGVDSLSFATGYGYLGLTLAAISAVLLVEMINGQAVSLDGFPYRLTRF